jgi:glycosyltransferase involved in cell wall biosynthesis
VLSLSGEKFDVVLVQEKRNKMMPSPFGVAVRSPLRLSGIAAKCGLHTLAAKLDRLLYFPSPAIRFARACVRQLLPRIKADLRHGRRVTLMTFVPPHDVLSAGLAIKRRLPNIRWIVDLQIVLALDTAYQDSSDSEWNRRLEEFEEAHLAEADEIIVESDAVANAFRGRYPGLRSNVRVIENAFDEQDAAAFACKRREASGNHTFEFAFIGNMFKPPKVPGSRLIEALDYVYTQGFKFRLRVIGDRTLLGNSHGAPPRPWLITHGRTSHHECLKLAAEADALLLFLADTEWSRILMHAKLPYYLASGIPVLAIVPDLSNTSEILRRTGAGVVVDSSGEWGPKMLDCLRAWNPEALQKTRRPEVIARYSWRNISRKWIDCIAIR